MGTIRVGVSGWDYRDWEGGFYPDDLPRRRHLAYAARQFDTIEVNGTFYGLTTPDACRSWYRDSPADFVFSLKGSRYITHTRKLADARAALANFFASGPLELDDKLGPVLWQLPASLHFDADRVDRFLGLLPHDTHAAADLARGHDDRVEDAAFGPGANHRLRHVLEVRHDSYRVPELVRIARRHGVCLAVSHASEWPLVEEVTAGFLYLRLHGPGRIYESRYDEEALRHWADRIRAWHAAEEPEDAARITGRRPPPRKGRDVYAYFDNDGGGLAPRQAAALRGLLG